MTTERTTYEGHIAEDIQKFVAGGLVLPLQRTGLKETEVACIAMFSTNLVGKFVELLLRHDAVVDNESVGEITATNQSHLKQGGYLANKDKGTGGGKVR